MHETVIGMYQHSLALIPAIKVGKLNDIILSIHHTRQHASSTLPWGGGRDRGGKAIICLPELHIPSTLCTVTGRASPEAEHCLEPHPPVLHDSASPTSLQPEELLSHMA